MTREIKTITVVTSQGCRSYSIGDTINGMKVDCIHDYSVEYQESIHTFYEGVDVNGNAIFRLEYAPVDIEFFPPEKEKEDE